VIFLSPHRLIAVTQTTYVRLIFSSNLPDAPSTCVRTVTGDVSYQLLGWYVTSANIGFLIPLTLINGAALVALCLAMNFARGGYLRPSQPRQVVYDTNDNEEVPDEWKEKVAFRPTTVRCF
jgi:hypothetical protein